MNTHEATGDVAIYETDQEWNGFTVVNDPISSKKLPNEIHSADDDWEAFEAVNDPASGKQLPDEVHANGDDDWESFEAVNDPASGKQLPDEVHALHSATGGGHPPLSGADARKCIYVTETFVRDITDIYGEFTPSDDEYPAMGITVQGAPVFVKCLRFPDCSVTRHRVTDAVERSHPEVSRLWNAVLKEHNGKCRSSTVHIHPMGLDRLSGTDIGNYESLRTNPDDPSTFPTGCPYPVILVNLLPSRKLELVGFWVMDGQACRVDVVQVPDESAVVSEAWEKSEQMPFFTGESGITRRIDRMVSKTWSVELGLNPGTGEKAIKARRDDGIRILIRFDPESPLGLTVAGIEEGDFRAEYYVDWTRMFNDLVDRREQPEVDGPDAREKTEQESNKSEEAEPTAVEETDYSEKIVMAARKRRKQMNPRMFKQILFKNLSLRRRK